jgi:hypothetical protein
MTRGAIADGGELRPAIDECGVERDARRRLYRRDLGAPRRRDERDRGDHQNHEYNEQDAASH